MSQRQKATAGLEMEGGVSLGIETVHKRERERQCSREKEREKERGVREEWLDGDRGCERKRDCGFERVL
ncbi:hypothetical protein L484_020903 [Morus notabilis]|uniref:Uncharacterized protein n=1 Tax=Morus notabilis TaxID=981085 RepID=W9QED1_9ROSA|nr:hypothetical protein L484_020903 [Morus notabilis]